jgi:hypothetical protein
MAEESPTDVVLPVNRVVHFLANTVASFSPCSTTMTESSPHVVHRFVRLLADTVASSLPISNMNNDTASYDDTATTSSEFYVDPQNTTAVEVAAAEALEKVEEEHEFDALTSLLINVTIIGCLLISYTVKKFRIYYLPESAGAMVVGMVVGGMARLLTPDNLLLFEFVRRAVDVRLWLVLAFLRLLVLIIFLLSFSLAHCR